MINLLVDIDGTILLVPREVDTNSSAIMFKKIFNIEASEEMVENSARPERYIISEVVKKFGIDPETKLEAAYRAWGEANYELLKNNPGKIMPGIIELFDNLKNNPNVKLLLLTGNSRARAESKLKSTGLDVYFRDPKTQKLLGVFGEDGYTREELLLKFLKNKKTDDKFIILDDSLLGGQMAKKNNVPIILVATGKFSIEQLSPYSENVFEDLGEGRWKEVLRIIVNNRSINIK